MKSFFTKLGTLLLCGVAVAVVGCTDFSQDIREGDEALKVEIDKLNQSTSATIAELKASISALEAAQKKMENDYAKKTDLDAAKTELQAALNEKVTEFSTAIATINTTLDGKADKTALSALQKEMEDAIAAAEATIANLDAAQKTLEAELAKKADKAETDKVAADVETLKNGYQETAFALTNLQSALEGTQLDLEATESALKTVAADVESLKQAYMEIVAGFQQFQADLAAKASQADLELAEKDIKDLKTASAEATFAIANLSTAVEVIEARVDGIENELNKAKEQIAQQTTQLTNLAYDLEQAKGDLEAEAELREAADKALQTEVAQLVYGLTNLQGAYDVHVQEYEAYKDALKKQLDDLAAQDGALANSIISYYEQAIAAVVESEAALKTLVEEEIAKVTNLIAQERTEIEGMIAYVEKSFAEADEALFTLVQDSLITVVYNTIYNYDTKYEAMFATVDEKIAAMDDEFRRALSALAQQDSTLDAMISAVDADLQAKYAEAMMAVVTNRTEIEGMIAYMDEELKGLIAGLTERVEKLEVDVEGLKAALADLNVALEEGLAETLELAFKNDAGVMDNVRAFEEKVQNIVKELNDKDAKIEAKHAEEIAAIMTSLEKINAELADNAEWQGQITTTITQLSNNLWEALGLLETSLQAKIEEVAKKFNEELTAGLAKVLESALANDADLKKELRAFEEQVNDMLGKLENKVNDLEKQTAELENAIKALQDAHATLTEQLQNKLTNIDNALAEIDEAHKDDVKALQNAHALLSAQLEEALGRINGQIEDLEEAVADNKKAIEKNGASIEANTELINKNAGEIVETNLVITDLKAAFEAYKKTTDVQLKMLLDNDSALGESIASHFNKAMGELNKTNESLAKTQEALNAAVGRIDALEEAFEAFEALAKEKFEALVAKDFELEREIETQTDLLYTAIKHLSLNVSNNANAIAQLNKAVDAANKLISDLRVDVDALLARVQSMVYVPEWDDHKAPIGYSELMINAAGTTTREPVYVMKESVLRYRVHAVAGESDVEAANDIAELYAENPAAFDYHVEAVKTRAAEADLEIRNIQAGSQIKNADPKFVYVTVVAKNFDKTFFSGQATKGYSASLILSDGNNNRSTEYTNLFADKKGDYISAYLVNKDGKDWASVFDAEGYFYLPYDDTKTTIEPFKGAYVQFDLDGTKYTEAELKAQGYVFSVTHDGGIYYHEKNAKRAEKQIIADDRYARFLDPLTKKMGFSLPKKSPVTYDGNNAVPSVYFALTSEGLMPDYKATAVELTKAEIGRQVVFIYDYKVNGVSIFGNDVPQSAIEITNRLVKVNLVAEVPWTLEMANSTIDGSGNIYKAAVSVNGIPYDLTAGADADKDISAYSLLGIRNSATKTNGGAYNIGTPIDEDNKTFGVTLEGKYEFPANNNDEKVDWNEYYATYRTDMEDLTVIMTVTIKLGEMPKAQALAKDVDFTTKDGISGSLFGYWDVLADAYEQFKPYLGYKDEAAGKAAFEKAFGTEYLATYTSAKDYLLVNTKPGVAANVNAPFTAGEHMFRLYASQLVADANGYVDLTKQTIQQVVETYFGVPFTFTVNGTVKLPAYDLTYDVNRVDDRDNEKIVNVEGEIAGGVYTVDVSDLAKYFYVVNDADVKKLERVNANDEVTVDFTLSHEIVGENKEGGYNFNGVADDVEHTLAVNWEKKENYILPMRDEFTNPLDAAVVNWGTYNSTEVKVNAVLKVNGFPVTSKPLTLVTVDPLEIALNDAHVAVVHKPGTNAAPVEGKVYQNFVLTSDVEPEVENLFNLEAWTLAGLFKDSKADTKYGVKLNLEYIGVFYDEDGDGKVNIEDTWDESKISLGRYDADKGPYKAGDLNGTVSIKTDDGNLTNPIHVRFVVTMEHRIHDRAKTICETVGTVDVIFTPEK